MSSSPKIEAFRFALRKELAAQFRLDPAHAGIERILYEAEAHLEDDIAERIEAGLTQEIATTEALARFGTASELARAYRALGAPRFINPRENEPAWRRLFRRNSASAGGATCSASSM